MQIPIRSRLVMAADRKTATSFRHVGYRLMPFHGVSF